MKVRFDFSDRPLLVLSLHDEERCYEFTASLATTNCVSDLTLALIHIGRGLTNTSVAVTFYPDASSYHMLLALSLSAGNVTVTAEEITTYPAKSSFVGYSHTAPLLDVLLAFWRGLKSLHQAVAGSQSLTHAEMYASNDKLLSTLEEVVKEVRYQG